MQITYTILTTQITRLTCLPLQVLKIQVDSNTGLFDNSETMSVFSDDGHRFSGCSVAASYGGNMLLGSVVTKMMQCSLDSTTSALEPMTEALTEA